MPSDYLWENMEITDRQQDVKFLIVMLVLVSKFEFRFRVVLGIVLTVFRLQIPISDAVECWIYTKV